MVIDTALDTGISTEAELEFYDDLQYRWPTPSPTLRWAQLEPGGTVHCPKKQGDVGYDLETPINISITDEPMNVPTGVAVQIPQGYWGLICARSSALSLGLVVYSGVIDEGYRGPLYARASSIKERGVFVKRGTRLAQLILIPAAVLPLEQVQLLDDSERGATGFGSTGGTG